MTPHSRIARPAGPGRRRFHGILRSPLAAASLVALAACGGGGGGGGGDAGASNRAPLANAGPDLMASRSAVVALDGRASSDPDGDTLSYSWRQVRGANATGGGTLSGANPSFTAPEGVQTLEFELTVSDGKGGSHVDSVIVHVLEDAANALFVDGDAGSDASGNGSMASPYASVRHALAQVGSSRGDLYLRVRAGGAGYDEAGATLALPSGTSLYGGYGGNWERDPAARKAELRTNALGLRYNSVTHDTWVSGLVIRAAGSSNPDDTVTGIAATGNGSARMVVEDNQIVAGSVGPGTSANPASSYGVYLRGLAFAAVLRNDITAGAGGSGAPGSAGTRGADGGDGSNGNRTGGNRAAGGSGGPGGNGGLGGARGGGINGDGGGGGDGGDGSAPRGGTVSGGTGGAGGSGNRADGGSLGNAGNSGGPGVPGDAGSGRGTLGSGFSAERGLAGGTGGHGSGGGGGGGGEANNVGVVGGGGGGGGEGGAGGSGGQGGQGGGASVGLWIHTVTSSEIVGNTITAGQGGAGAMGGDGGGGGSGGSGGSGAAGDSQGLLGRGGGGADGRAGGFGGTGGRGGAGGGGPSYGVVIGPNMAPVVADNRITSGAGGAAGNGGIGGNGGEGGYSFTLWDINPNDGQLPVLGGNNVLTVGNAGAGGSTSGTGGSAGPVGRSGQRNW